MYSLRHLLFHISDSDSDIDVVNEDSTSSEEDRETSSPEVASLSSSPGSAITSSLPNKSPQAPTKTSFKSSKFSAFSKISILAQSSAKADPKDERDEQRIPSRPDDHYDNHFFRQSLPHFPVAPASNHFISGMFPYLDPRFSLTHYYKNLHKVVNENSKNVSVHPRFHLSTKSNVHENLHITVPKESNGIFQNIGTLNNNSTPAPSTVRKPETVESSSCITTHPASSSISPTVSSSMVPDQATPEHQGLRFTAPAAPVFGLRAVDPSSSPYLPVTGPAPGPGLLYSPYQGLTGGGARDASKPPQAKKYKCDICSKAFSRSNTLVTHKVCVLISILIFKLQ